MFSIFFSILLVGGIVYYIVQTNISFLRRDRIPSNAIVVPWMIPNPSVETVFTYSINSQPWNIESVMAGSVKISASFAIKLVNETRNVSSTVYLGHDSTYLYVGADFHGIFLNPTAVNNTNAPPHIFAMLFDVDNEGNLTFPEAGTLVDVGVFENASLNHDQEVWSFDDLFWWNSQYWSQGYEYYSPKAAPGHAVKAEAVEYDNVTGTLTIVYSRSLSDPSDSQINKFQMKSGERWVMSFMLMAGFADRYNLYQNMIVSWPQGYSFQSADSSWWPKLAIDLGNPPNTYPGS